MPKSMTGYGRNEVNADGWTHVWEIRSVNGRFLDVKWRIPGFLRSLEAEWEKAVREAGSRGRVDVSLNLEIIRADIMGVSFNATQADAMLEQMQAFAAVRGHVFEPDYNRLLGMSALWRDTGSEPDPGLAASLTDGLRAALRDWNGSRAVEGEAMKRDIMERISTLRGYAEAIRARVPVVLEERKQGLRDRIAKILESMKVGDYSEDRMLQEVATLTDRIDVSEELTRMDAHLERLEQTLDGGGEIGKKLDFLVQETFREINTCGNKAQDTEASRLVVDFKAELEKCREQVQNIE